jgi:hypothetical protein
MEEIDDKVEAEKFSKLMRNIFNSPMSNPNNSSNTEKKTNTSNLQYVIQVQEEKSHFDRDTTPQIIIPNEKPIGEKQEQFKSNRVKTHSVRQKSRVINRELAPVKSHPHEPIATETQQPISDYVRIFERLFRSFRQQVFDCFGDKCEEVITKAEKKIRFLSPEFDCHNLSETTVLTMLDVIESIIQEASMFKRSKLRQAALTLISDLYNKQYELLEQHRAIDKVEQIYYRLKK